MTNPASPMPPSPASPRSLRGPILALLILLLVAFAGGLAGVAFDRLVLSRCMDRGPGPGPFGVYGRPGHRGPPRDREFRDRFAREVGLTREQQTRVDSIMDREGLELRAVRGRVRPQVDSIISRTRRQLDSVLTPEQRKKAEEIRRRHPRPPGPPPGDFPPGPPPR